MTLSQADHFLFNSSLFAPKLRMMLRGIRVDQSKLEELKAEAAAGVWGLQAEIDGVAGGDEIVWLHKVVRREVCVDDDKLWEQAFASICLRYLGGSNPRVRRNVTVERWQPMKWEQKLRGKEPGLGRWKKTGKLLLKPVMQENHTWIASEEPPGVDWTRIHPQGCWLKPAHKTVSCLRSFTPSILEDCEPFVIGNEKALSKETLTERRAVWKRVKQIWKELKNERNTDEIRRDGDGDSTEQCGRETEIHGGESGVDGGGSALGGETEVKATADGSTSTSDCKRTCLAGESALFGGGDPGETPQSKEMVCSGDGKVGQCSAALLGELSTLLGLAVNAGSTSEGGDSQWFLYEVCGLPRMYCDARTGRYSRETEAEWRKRTKEGVKYARRKSNRLADRKAATGNPGDSLRDQGGLGSAGADPGQSESDSAGGAAEDENGGVRHERRRKSAKTSHGKLDDSKRAGAIFDNTQPDAEGLGAGGQSGDAGGMDTVPEGNSAGESAKSSKKISTDQIALVRLYAHSKDVRLLWVLQQRRLRKVVTDLSTKLDPDGRLRASISLVKETGRMSESAAPTGCGLNRQALNKDLLSICIPDEDYEMAKLDLEGADSWTVAAEAASLGDPTMLDDLKAGIKPAQVVGLIYLNGVKVNEWPRESIRQRLTELAALPWLYPGAKATAHESPYGGGWETTQMILLKNSMADLPLDLKDSKPIVLSKKQIDDLQGAFFSRYPGVRKWQQKVGRQLMEKGYLQTSTGHVRRFYGRKVEIKAGRRVVNHSTLREALSSMPQYYTTYSIKQAWSRMWFDPANWPSGIIGSGISKVEPLALKHDEILMQWRKEDRPWALKKLPEWFRTPVRIAGIEVVIPAAGKIGCNWSMKEGETIQLC